MYDEQRKAEIREALNTSLDSMFQKYEDAGRPKGMWGKIVFYFDTDDCNKPISGIHKMENPRL